MIISTHILQELHTIFGHFREGPLSFEEKMDFVSQLKINGSVELIGYGSSSTVFRIGGPDQSYALKAMLDKEMYNREVAALQLISSHPSVISLKGFTTINRHYCVCLEHLPHESLWEYIRTVPPERSDLDEEGVFRIFAQIVSAVVHMHQKRVSHHDLNSRNILIDPASMKVKIIDFGLAVFVPYGASSFVDHGYGTPLYLPLEVLEGRSHDPRAVDVWSLGVILVEMFLQTHPWRTAKSMVDLARMIMARSIVFPSDKSVSTQARTLIDLMLTIDPADRIRIEKVQEMVQEKVECRDLGVVIAG